MIGIRCVRCGHPAERRGQIHPELHRVLYLCDDLCQWCVDELHEWWMRPSGAANRAKDATTTWGDDMRLPNRHRHRRLGRL